jgi:hypothetical protein
MAVALDQQSRPFLQELQPLWHDCAPRRLVSSSSPDNPLGGWKAWRKHLAKRRNPEPPEFLPGNEPPLLWGWPRSWQRDSIRAFLALNERESALSLADAVEAFLARESTAGPDLPMSLRLVALAYTLPTLSKHVPAERWWHLLERLHDLAMEAQEHRVDWPAEPQDVVRQQLLAGELPLALGYLFPEVRALRSHQKAARSALTEAILELTDGQGLPHGRLLPVLGPLLACWTRARWLGERLKKGSWSAEAEVQYEWLVRHAIRLAAEHGRFLLTERDELSPAWNDEMLSTALTLAGDKRDAAAATAAIGKKVVPKRLKSSKGNLPAATMNSDWSGIAVMASGWSQSDARLAVGYADNPVTMELSSDGETLFAGAWSSETSCDDAKVHVAEEWERLCWETGKQYAFLELGVDLSQGIRLERQILFAPRDRCLYLADIVTATDGQPHRLHHSMRLPTPAQVAWNPEFETRDGTLTSGKTRAAVLPLSLGEWRSDPRGGSLTLDEGHLVLTQEVAGRSMCCALFIDLDKVRSEEQRTWRHLTVAEWMEILPRDVAVAFRAQSGDDQWLFYRSLGPTGNRSFMGQNTAGEFSAGRFLSTGKYKEWIEVESV